MRFLTLAIAALLTANGVIIAEQASGRDLITLGRDGVDNAREAIARLLDDNQTTKVAGEVVERSTTTTAPAESTTTTGAPAAVTPPPVETPTSGPAATAPPTTATTAKPKPKSNGTNWVHVADTVRPYVEKETSLPFKGAVPVAVLDGGAFGARLNAVRLNPAMERARRAEATLGTLGIIEPGVNLAEQVKRLSTGSVTAFYDVKANELVIREGQLTPFVLTTIVHELVRADYDQHFELDRPNLAMPDDETGVAFDSLVEGTASRIKARFISALPDKDKQQVQAEQQRLAAQLPKDLPDYVLVQYAFPFGTGPRFADALMSNGGAGRVNGAFQNPPRTTEQIIHPDKFFAGEGPKPLADPAADGAVVRSGSLGQLMLTLMLAQVLESGDAESAADGWGADRYVVWQNGGQTCVRLAVTPDAPGKAAELGQALNDWAQNTPGGTVAGTGPFTVTRCA
ncbi:MAG TPA: hypothetical protein VG795_11865 [Acidimicrobiia bacterium]|nr:hypothetical protein [Acidimicrobiia bacterium]